MKKNLYKIVFPAMCFVCLLVPFSIDIFIPGLPAIGKYFPGANVSLILSISLLGFAVAQPIYGPLLDRFGRRPVLLIGLWIYTAASIQVMLAETFYLLILGRFFQAIGACSAVISVYAIAKDIYGKEKIVTIMSLITGMIGISPAIAPLIGVLLTSLWGWRSCFVFLFVMGCFFVLFIQCFFKETLHEKNMGAILFKNIIGNYHILAMTPYFLIYCLVSGFSYSIWFSYFNLSSLFIIQQMHCSLIDYGIIVSLNAIAITIMACVVPIISRQITLLNTMRLGLIVILLGGLIMWLINITFVENLYTFMLPMFLTTIGIGMIRPVASASIMQLAPQQISGSAAGFFNFVSFASGSIATVISGRIISCVSDFGIFTTIMAICAISTLLVDVSFSKNYKAIINYFRA